MRLTGSKRVEHERQTVKKLATACLTESRSHTGLTKSRRTVQAARDARTALFSLMCSVSLPRPVKKTRTETIGSERAAMPSSVAEAATQPVGPRGLHRETGGTKECEEKLAHC